MRVIVEADDGTKLLSYQTNLALQEENIAPGRGTPEEVEVIAALADVGTMLVPPQDGAVGVGL